MVLEILLKLVSGHCEVGNLSFLAMQKGGSKPRKFNANMLEEILVKIQQIYRSQARLRVKKKWFKALD